MKMNESTEDYLEAILTLQSQKGFCRSIDIARHLHFSKPSVSIAMNKLEQAGYVVREQDGSISLTEAGHAIADNTLSKHHFFARILKQLGVPEETAEREACLIEHDISDETYEIIRAWDRRSQGQTEE